MGRRSSGCTERLTTGGEAGPRRIRGTHRENAGLPKASQGVDGGTKPNPSRAVEKELFGDWMVVQRTRQRPRLMPQKKTELPLLYSTSTRFKVLREGEQEGSIIIGNTGYVLVRR